MTKAFAWKLQRTSGSSVSTRRGGILCNMIFSLWNLFRCVKSYVPKIHGLVPKKSHLLNRKNSCSVLDCIFDNFQQPPCFFLSHLLSSFFVERPWKNAILLRFKLPCASQYRASQRLGHWRCCLVAQRFRCRRHMAHVSWKSNVGRCIPYVT